MALASATAAITAQNTFTTPLYFENRKFNVSVWGTFVATVTLQRSFDDGTTWLDIAEYTTATETNGEEVEQKVYYRIGVKTGAFTSGTANVRIAQ